MLADGLVAYLSTKVDLYIWEDVMLKRDASHWKSEVQRMKMVECLQKKKQTKKKLWDLADFSLWPLGCQSVLEAKIEIPDTPVVNIAHASSALKQALL